MAEGTESTVPDAKGNTTPSASTQAAPVDQASVTPQAESNATGGVAKDGLAEPAAVERPLDALFARLTQLIEEAGHDEIYGVQLKPSSEHIPTQVILQKFLRANANDLNKAQAQLLATLKWRKDYKPLLTKDETFSKERFDGLGYVVELKDGQVVTFNVYGGVKDNEVTFKDIDGFLRWRVGIMELGLAKLNLSSTTVPLPAYGEGPDPYQGIQVHDYLNISFLRQNPYVKAASKEAIALFSNYYPETLSRKFFVNVPVVMGWMFSAAKLMLSKETVRKFTVLSYGKDLAPELGGDSLGIPKVYGGAAEDLGAIGETLKLD